MQTKLIFIEGVDRVGKGSLMQAMHKATNYKHIIFDRSVISNIVYSIAYNRLTPELYVEYSNIEEQLAKTNHVVLHLTCSTDVLKERMVKTGHEYIDFDSHKRLFESFCGTSPLNVVTLDTTTQSPEELASILKGAGII